MTASSPKQRWRRGPRVIRGRSNPGKGAGRRWGNSERRGGGPVEGEDRCSWCSLPRQSGRRVGGRGREGVGRARSTAGRPSGSGRDRNPVKIRVGGRFNHGSVPIGLFLKGDAPLSKRTEPGARGRGPAALGGARQLHGTGDLPSTFHTLLHIWSHPAAFSQRALFSACEVQAPGWRSF